MFLAKWKEDGQEKFNIYFDDYFNSGTKAFFEDTFSPNIEDVETLKLSVKGNTYEERKESAIELAKDYQYNFSGLSWSYGELAEIQGYFTKIAKRYGLVNEFKENGIC